MQRSESHRVDASLAVHVATKACFDSEGRKIRKAEASPENTALAKRLFPMSHDPMRALGELAERGKVEARERAAEAKAEAEGAG